MAIEHDLPTGAKRIGEEGCPRKERFDGDDEPATRIGDQDPTSNGDAEERPVRGNDRIGPAGQPRRSGRAARRSPRACAGEDTSASTGIFASTPPPCPRGTVEMRCRGRRPPSSSWRRRRRRHRTIDDVALTRVSGRRCRSGRRRSGSRRLPAPKARRACRRGGRPDAGRMRSVRAPRREEPERVRAQGRRRGPHDRRGRDGERLGRVTLLYLQPPREPDGFSRQVWEPKMEARLLQHRADAPVASSVSAGGRRGRG